MPSLTDYLAEYRSLSERLSHPETIPQGEFKKLASRRAELEVIANLHERLEKLSRDIAEHREVLASEDAELATLAADELRQAEDEHRTLSAELRRALLPKDPNADKDVVMEIRAGAGGDEASLFAHELFTMYTRYAEERGWQVHIVSESRSDLNGFKEVILEISGDHVYDTLRFESGVHRVQRIPETEKSGRVHTSTATVVVLPKAEEVDLTIRPEDVRIDTYRAGGHGGQGVQKTDSAVRITHIPTGLVVQCQDERSQQKNRERAMGVLRSRLLARSVEEYAKTQGAARRAQIGTGDRSEKIRTYNIPQNRVTDHRIKMTWHAVDHILAGGLTPVLEALKHTEEEQLLAESSS